MKTKQAREVVAAVGDWSRAYGVAVVGTRDPQRQHLLLQQLQHHHLFSPPDEGTFKFKHKTVCQ